MSLLLLIILLFSPVPITAQEMSSPSYTLELEQIEATAEAKTDSLNPLQYKNFIETGYIIESSDTDTFQFSISDTTIRFTNLNQNPRQTHTLLATVTSTDNYGYQLLAIPIQHFETSNGDQIPPTQCDGKEQTCTYLSAKTWESNGQYGWGYSISGPDAAPDFIDETFYRPFKIGESVVIAQNATIMSQRATKMTIKTVIAPELSDGNYRSVIKLIAFPKL